MFDSFEKKENIKFSIIVPVYNVEKYLEKCLDSLVNQTYKNYEVILINDGSTDRSKNICEKITNKNNNFILINQENKGLSGARNTGLKYVNGDYILFVDSDDWIDTNCLEKINKEILSDNELDLILFPYIKENNKSIQVKLFEGEMIFEKNKIKEKIIKRLFGLSNEELKSVYKLENLNTAWGKVYKKEVIKKDFIDTKEIGTEDAIFNIYNLVNCKKAKYIESTNYHYRKDNNTSLTRNYKKDFFVQWKRLYELMEENIKEQKYDLEFKVALDNRIILNLFSLVVNVVDSNLKYYKKILELKKLLSDKMYEEKFKKFKIENLNFEWKIFYLLCKNKKINMLYIYTKIGLWVKGNL